MDQTKKYEEFTLPLNLIVPDENQPRKQFSEDKIEALATDIEKHGLIEPIVVTPIGDDKYKIISGERRCRAYKFLADKYPEDSRWKTIKVSVNEDDNPLLSIKAKLVKLELNPMEYAVALRKLEDSIEDDAGGSKTKKLMELTGKSKANISEWRSLLKLPKEIQDHARINNTLPFRTLKQIAAEKGNDHEKCEKYYNLCEEKSEAKTQDIPETDIKLHKKIHTVKTKIDSTLKSLSTIKIEKITNEDDKRDLLESMDKIITEAEKIKSAINAT